jgi:hypothetical protein
VTLSVREAPARRRRRWLLALAVSLLPTAVLLGGLQLLRWHAMGEAEQADLRLMQREPLAGENGFPWLLMSSYDIEPAAVPAAMQTELEDFRRWHAKPPVRRSRKERSDPAAAPRGFVLRVSTGHAARPVLKRGKDSPLCPVLVPACLAHVHQHLEAVRAMVQDEAPRLAMLERVMAADHFDPPAQHGFPDAPYDSLGLLQTRAALDAIEGRVGLAVDRTCGLISDSRRLLPRNRGMLAGIVLRMQAAGAAALLLDIRRENPGLILPASCRAALAPVQAAELEVCPALRTELAIMHDLILRNVAAQTPQILAPAAIRHHLFEHEPLQLAWLARDFAAYCRDPARAAFAAGEWRAPAPRPGPVPRDSLACYAAIGPCARSHRMPAGFSNATGHVIEAAAIFQLLLAAHRVADGGPGEAPVIPGYPVSHDPVANTWTIKVRYSKPLGKPIVVALTGLEASPGP